MCAWFQPCRGCAPSLSGSLFTLFSLWATSLTLLCYKARLLAASLHCLYLPCVVEAGLLNCSTFCCRATCIRSNLRSQSIQESEEFSSVPSQPRFCRGHSNISIHVGTVLSSLTISCRSYTESATATPLYCSIRCCFDRLGAAAETGKSDSAMPVELVTVF